MISVSVSVQAALQAPIGIRVSLYSDEWTSDHLPRQKSADFLTMKDYGAKVGLPDQMQLVLNQWIPLTEKRQVWFFNVLCLAAYGKTSDKLTRIERPKAISEWASLMDGGRCFTNRKGWNNGRADYIQRLNLNADPMEWEPLLLGGNQVKVIGNAFPLSNNYLGQGTRTYLHYPIRVVNPEDLPDPAAFLSDRAVCHVPTTIRPDGTKGIFPQFGGRAVYPLWALHGSAYVWDRLIT